MVNDSRDGGSWEQDHRPMKKPRMSDPDIDDNEYNRGGGAGGGGGGSGSGSGSAGGPRDYDRSERRYESDRDLPHAPPAPLPPSGGMGGDKSGQGKGMRLLLANLSYTTREDDITDFFRDAGAEVEKVELVKVQNRVNGNAYVWLADERSVDIALDLDGRGFAGRKLRVSEMPEGQRTACVRGLRPGSRERDVEALFEGCHIVGLRCRPVKGGPTDMSTWFVDFADEVSFERALAKDRSAPGLMICIATAQGSGTRGRRDDYGGADNDAKRDAMEKRDGGGYADGDDARGKARNGVGNGSPLGSRARSRSRSRTPPSRGGYERRHVSNRSSDRYGDPKRSSYDKRDRYAQRGHDWDRRGSPQREERYRGEFDRGRERDMDRRDHRRDFNSGYSGRDRDFRRERDYERDRDRDRDRNRDRDREKGRERDRDRDRDRYRERERDRDRERDDERDRDRDRDFDRERDMDRGRRGGGRIWRSERDHYGSRYAEPPRDRRFSNKPLDPSVTTVLTNLPFCEDRDRVIDSVGKTLERQPGAELKISEVIPVGRRCGAAIVVFKDSASHVKAVDLQSLMVSSRKVNILPLEVPSVARVQKLEPGYMPDEILNDMRRRYDVESLFVKHRQHDQLLLGLDDSRFLVRLLDIDGRPLLNSRYATVSYIPSRQYSDSNAGRNRRAPDEYDDPNGRGGDGSYRDRDLREDRDGFGKDRRRDGDMDRGDSRGDHDDPRRSGDSRSYQHGKTDWKVRVTGLRSKFSRKELLARLEIAGIEDVEVEITDDLEGFVSGRDISVMRKVMDICNEKAESSFLASMVESSVEESKVSERMKCTGNPVDNEDRNDTPQKEKSDPDEEWKSKAMSTPLSSTPSRTFRISPLTPSPGECVLPPRARKEPIDPKLARTVERLDNLRSAIMEREEEEDRGGYEDFCSSLDKLCEPQKLIYTMSNNIDPIPPQVWAGDVRKGSNTLSAKCNGYLVLNSRQKDDRVRRTINELPVSINIERRGRWEDENFAHLLRPESVVIILKAADEGGTIPRRVCKDGKIMAKSKEVLNGILQSLRGKQKMGIAKYTLPDTDKKFVALCIPPNPYIFEEMRIPWRFRAYAGHDSLMLIVGPKVAEGRGS